MSESIRQQLPTIVAIAVIGLVAGVFALEFIHGQAAVMDVGAFETWILVVPCAVMLLAAFFIGLTASVISKRLYQIVVGICLVAGVVCMLVTSSWLSNADTAAQLLANSADGAQVTPILNSPLLILRDIAAFFVMPTVGLIAGAWLGARLHPLEAETAKGKRKK